MKPEFILQIETPNDYETLEVFASGRIICTCLRNLYDKARAENSTCSHAVQLRNDIIENKLEKYIWV